MTEEKQIEEIYKVIMEAELGFPKANLPLLDIERYIAEAIYNASYRKQSEGEWLHDTKWDTFYCSICGESALNDCYENQSLSGYCPHCGANMKGGAE